MIKDHLIALWGFYRNKNLYLTGIWNSDWVSDSLNKLHALTKQQKAEIKQCVDNLKVFLASKQAREAMIEYLAIVRQNVE